MRNVLIFVLLSFFLSAVGCGKGSQINGSSNKTLYRSVTTLKERLPEKQRVEFEVAFWSLKQSEPDDAAFRTSVDGKTVKQIIAMGKDNFAKKKAAGTEGYGQYASWDSMIDTLVTQRQDIRVFGKSKKDQQNTLQFNR